ncbi:RNase adapter RapZ [bacterium]|nr:RNase adapter RapZ [bacterium]
MPSSSIPFSEDIQHIESLVLLIGLSGAGKSSANRAFSDEGYYSIDNLPIALLPNFLSLSRSNPTRFKKTSVLLDIISEEQREQFIEFIEDLPQDSPSWQIIFLDTDSQTLQKRYSETRRPHPALSSNPPPTSENNMSLSVTSLPEAIEWERTLLHPLKERASVIIDSSRLSPHDLRRQISSTIASFHKQQGRKLQVHFQSFGFKFGAPTDCDLIIDVRFLPNPHFDEQLRPLTGRDAPVKEYVLGSTVTQEFIERYLNLLEFLLPHYIHEGKAYLNIGIGCTGGKHRSVAIAQELAARLSSAQCDIRSTDRDREKS